MVLRKQSQAHPCNTPLPSVCLGVKEDSSPVVSSPDVIAVYLHLPYTGHACFLFQQEEEQDHFLSALKTCIRHRNLGKTFIQLLCLWPSFTPCAVSLFEVWSPIRIRKMIKLNEFNMVTWERCST